MAFENEIVPFFQWLFGGDGAWGAIVDFLIVVGILAAGGIVLGYLLSAVRHGPVVAFSVVGNVIKQAVPDLLLISPRRIFAVARLAVAESRRNRVLVVFGVFVLVMLLAGWFISDNADHPGRLYLSFVLTASNYLVLGLALFLSAFSLPGDIKNRTIYTVVTKPVRASEIVLGRILGFLAVGTVLLATMWLVSYVFVVRGLHHEHAISVDDMNDTSAVAVASEDGGAPFSSGKTGQTSYNGQHRHKEVIVDAHGRGKTEIVQDHWHEVWAEFDLRGQWKFTITDDEDAQIVLTGEIGGSRRRPKITLNAIGGASESLSGVRLESAQLTSGLPGSLVGRSDEGQLDVLALLPADGQPNLLGLLGTIAWPDESQWKVFGRQTEATGEEDLVRYLVGKPQDALQSRVTHFGKIRFLDSNGKEGGGISVGKEWTYRKYISGGSRAAAIWTFDNITPKRYPNEQNPLPLELNLRVFRTFKGRDITQRVTGTITLKNPDKNIRTVPIPFTSSEYSIQNVSDKLPRKLPGPPGIDGRPRELDLFDDLVSDGRLELWIQCAEPGQYFGMAQADAYLRVADSWFIFNFTKGYVSIWLQMLVVICFGVMFSTFLSAAVAMMATVSVVIIGFFTEFIHGVTIGMVDSESAEAIVGGGPIESMIRLLSRKNLSQELDLYYDWITNTVRFIDGTLMFVMDRLVNNTLPNFSEFNTSDYVASGYNISGDLLANHCVVTLGFTLVLSVIGYVFLKTREIAA